MRLRTLLVRWSWRALGLVPGRNGMARGQGEEVSCLLTRCEEDEEPLLLDVCGNCLGLE